MKNPSLFSFLLFLIASCSICGCNSEAEIIAFENADLMRLYEDFDTQSKQLDQYRVDGVLIVPSFSPDPSGYDSFTIFIAVFAKETGRSVNIADVLLNGVSVLDDSIEIVVDEFSQAKFHGFKKSKIVEEGIPLSSIVASVGQPVTLEVKIKSGSKQQVIKYIFISKKKRIAVPIV